MHDSRIYMAISSIGAYSFSLYSVHSFHLTRFFFRRSFIFPLFFCLAVLCVIIPLYIDIVNNIRNNSHNFAVGFFLIFFNFSSTTLSQRFRQHTFSHFAFIVFIWFSFLNLNIFCMSAIFQAKKMYFVTLCGFFVRFDILFASQFAAFCLFLG